MSAVLSALLIFLKIVGFTILGIVGFVLFILLIVLFVPVRYSVDGAYRDKKPAVSAKASWLLHIVSVNFMLNRETPLVIRIFGFKIGGRKKKQSGKPKVKYKREKFKSNNATETMLSDISGSSQTDSSILFDNIKDNEILDGISEDELAEMLKENNPASGSFGDNNPVSDKIDENIDSLSENIDENNGSLSYNIDEKCDSLSDNIDINSDSLAGNNQSGKKSKAHKKALKEAKKAKRAEKRNKKTKKDADNPGIYDKIKGYFEIIGSDEFKASFALCKKALGKILKNVLPRKWNVSGKVGFDDPEKNGKVCAILGMLYPWITRRVDVYVDFEVSEIDVKAKAKGMIFGITFVYVGLKVILNRNIRKTIKMFTGGNNSKPQELEEDDNE